MVGGSQQLRQFRIAIRDGATLEEACAATGNIIEPAEGRIYLAADAKNPPPEEAYQLLYDPETRKESDMPRGKKSEDELENGDINGEYKTPDAKKAFEIFDEYIAPKLTAMATLRGDCAQPHQDIKKLAHFPRPVLNFINALTDIDDEAKLDHYLLALHEGLKFRGLTLPADMITRMDGSAGGPVVPSEGRNKPFLAAVSSEEDDEAFEDSMAAQDALAPGDEFEATQDELNAQEGRPKRDEAEPETEQAEAAE